MNKIVNQNYMCWDHCLACNVSQRRFWVSDKSQFERERIENLPNKQKCINCNRNDKLVSYTELDEQDMIINEDPRKTALKNGIRQLTTEQIQRTLDFDGKMAVDHGNYVDGCYCPLAIGVGLDTIPIKNPTNDSISAILCLMGYKVNNTRGIKGEFFTKNRLEDYKQAAQEVIEERAK